MKSSGLIDLKTMDTEGKGSTRKRWGRLGALVLFLLLVSLLKGAAVLNYSTWSVDEEQIVVHALGFLNGDLNPRWFGYHPLPMYILAIFYYLIYLFYLVAGIVSSKVEFASLLFYNEAVFFITARLLVSFAYSLGCFVLSYILVREYRSRLAAAVCFVLLLFLPDAVTASNYVRVDSFVFLFFSLTIYYGFFAKVSIKNIILAIVFCSAAIAAKLPAIVCLPILFLQLLLIGFRGEIRARTLFLSLLTFPVFIFLFMPFAFLDFDSYLPTLMQIKTRAAGEFIHVGKVYHYNIVDKLAAYWALFIEQVGVVSVVGSFLLGMLAVFKERKLLLPILFVMFYGMAFITSSILDGYWLRPVYPFFIFFTLIFIVLIGSKYKLSELWPKKEGALVQNNVSRSIISPLLITGLALFFVFSHNQGWSMYIKGLRAVEPDTRVRASKWIQEHIPAGSIVILEGHIQKYLPRVFSREPQVTLDNSFFDALGTISKNEFLTRAFWRFFRQEFQTAKNLVVATMIQNVALQYDTTKMVLPEGAYIIISSAVYQRFFSDPVVKQTPVLANNAQRFYSFIRAQRPVERFQGKGPIIDIYQMRESLNFP